MRLCRFLLFLLPLTALAQSPAGHRALTIVCFGDSITSGYGAPEGSSYPDYLRADLLAHGLAPRILNQGVTGDTTTGALTRIGPVLQAHPDVVILELGGNDGLRGVPVPTIQAQLGAIIERLRASHATVLLTAMTLPTNYGADYVKQFTAMYPALAHRYHLTLVPLPLKDVFSVPSRMNGDGIHPNAQGYQVMAQDMLPYVLPLVARNEPRT